MFGRLLGMIPLGNQLREHAGSQQLLQDAQAGITLAFLAIPQCMAYAVVANLHPINGLYAGIVAAITASLFMSSAHVVTGPTATVSLIVAGILYKLPLEPEVAVFYLTVMVGLFQVGFYLVGIGNLARFVSDAVVTGFVTGSAVVIIGGQLMSIFGAPGTRSAYFIVRFYRGVSELVQTPDFISPAAVVTGGLTIISLAGIRCLDDRLPASLFLLIAGALGSWWLELRWYGVELVGDIPSAVPVLSLPGTIEFGAIEQLFSGALALALFCSVQSLSIGKSIAHLSKQNINENQELLGQGMGNAVAGIFSGYPVGASFSRSFLNFNLGAVTQLSTLFCGVLIGLLTYLGARLIYFVPLPVLSGIIVVVVFEVVDLNDARVAVSTTVQDAVSFFSTFVGVIVLPLDLAIYLGVAVSLILYLRDSTELDLKEYVVDEDGNLKHITGELERIEPRVAVIDVSGEAFFGSANQIQDRVRGLCSAADDLRVIILRMKNAANFDVTGAAVLGSLAEELQEHDMTLMLCGTTPRIREVLEEAGMAEDIGEDKILIAQKNLLESTRAAIERAREHIDEVLEGNVERGEEDPTLDHTMEDLEEEPEDQSKPQDPIEQEKHTG